MCWRRHVHLGTSVYIYAQQQDETEAFNGIDGYLRASVIVMAAPNDDHISEWIGLDSGCVTCGGNGWSLQIGRYQGQSYGLPTYPSAAHIYYETDWCYDSGLNPPFLEFVTGDLGNPTADYPVYIGLSSTSSTGRLCLGSTWQVFPWLYKTGSWTSPAKIVYNQYVSSTVGYPLAVQEDSYFCGSHCAPEVINRNNWGLNSSGQVSSSYAMHLYTHSTNTWSLWTSSNAPHTQGYLKPTSPSGLSNPIAFCPLSFWSTFYAKWSAC